MEGNNDVGYTSGLVHHMAKQGTQNTECDCCCTLAAVEHHQRVLGTGRALERRAGNRWAEVEPIDHLVDSLGRHLQLGSARLGEDLQQHEHVPLRLYADSPLPSYEPSTLCGSP